MIRAVVTGGSRGIGFAIAQELAKGGAELLLVAKDATRLSDACQKLLDTFGRRPLHFAVDLGTSGAAAALGAFARENSFQPSVLVLGAGVFFEEGLEQATPARISAQITVNLTINIELVQQFLPALRAADNARVVIIGSTAAFEPYAYGPVYGITKWALRGFAENLRRELRPSRIGVSLIHPGGTWTDLWHGVELPRSRLLEPSDIATLVHASLQLSPQAVVDELIVRPIEGDMHD